MGRRRDLPRAWLGVTLGAAFSATLGLASARSFSSLLTVPPPVGHELYSLFPAECAEGRLRAASGPLPLVGEGEGPLARDSLQRRPEEWPGPQPTPPHPLLVT